MVKIEKRYAFEGPSGKTSLVGLFENRRQLIVYHFMFGPDWEKGCPSCTHYVDSLGDLSPLGGLEVLELLLQLLEPLGGDDRLSSHCVPGLSSSSRLSVCWRAPDEREAPSPQ